MRSFFKIFFASLLALIIFSIVAFFVCVGLLSAAVTSDKPVIAEKGVLVIELGKNFPEQNSQSFQKVLNEGGLNNVPSLYDVIRMIRHAKTDTNIKGIYLDASSNANGFAASEEIRAVLEDFKNSGKFIVAYGDVISERAYYIANVADKVYANPEGGLEWKGYSMTMVFLKGLLDKLEIEPQIFYAGQYKSATEPFRTTEMSAANREQMNALLNDLYAKLLITTSKRTNTDTASLHALANAGTIQTTEDAVKYKLLNGAKYDDEVKDEIRQWLKLSKSEKLNFVSLDKYKEGSDWKTGSGTHRIAVIYAAGDIIGGGSTENGFIASETMRDLINKARNDNNVKAIVFRVNSPGGSALASEVIWREIMLAKKQKPVVVSMGDYAASGGYYIACAGDSIYTDASTLTGSIGVFSIIPNMKNFFRNKLGVTFDGVKTGQYADMMTSDRPLTDTEKRMITNQTILTYATFKKRVAEGRKKDTAYVESIAQGRVWTGKKAVEIGLADKVGTLNDAIACAARMAKLKEWRLKEYPEQKSLFQQLFGTDSKKEVKQQAIKEEIGEEQYKTFLMFKRIQQMVGSAQTRLPFEAAFK
jgi:protease-4